MKHVAVIGIRGYGTIYSGFETFVKKLVEHSSESLRYTLYVRNAYQKDIKTTRQLRLICLLTIKNKFFETLWYTFLAHVHSLFIRDIDTVLYLGVANTPFIFLQKIFGRKVIVNSDGMDWQRKRWFPFGQLYLRICEYITVLLADIIICDSQTILKYFKKKYNVENAVFIAYGADIKSKPAPTSLKRFGLKQRQYFLTSGRLTPENEIEDLIKAFRGIKTIYRCVIIGDSIYEDDYKAYLHKLAEGDPRIIFTGFLQRQEYDEISSCPYMYIETKGVGGTHPSLLEMMAKGNAIISKDIEEHKEVLLNTALYYNKNEGYRSLQRCMEKALNGYEISHLGEAAQERVKDVYSWQEIVRQYESLF